jgi:hypothetical protein
MTNARHFALFQLLVQRRVSIQVRSDPGGYLKAFNRCVQKAEENFSVRQFSTDDVDQIGLKILQVARLTQPGNRKSFVTAYR